MTFDHLHPILESVKDTVLFWRFAQDLARAVVPDEIIDVVRLGHITALQKPTGGVRGIVAGDIIRRLVARTISQQIASAVEHATSPFQTLSRRSPVGSASLTHSKPSPTSTIAPQYFPLTALVHSTSSHEV